MVLVKTPEELRADFKKRGYSCVGSEDFPAFIKRVEEGWIVICTTMSVSGVGGIAYYQRCYFVSEEGRVCKLDMEECRFVESNNSMRKTFGDWKSFLAKKELKDERERIDILRFLADEKEEFAREVAFWEL